MTAAFKLRVAAGDAVPGLLLVPQRVPVGDVVAELELVCLASEVPDWAGRIDFLPL